MKKKSRKPKIVKKLSKKPVRALKKIIRRVRSKVVHKPFKIFKIQKFLPITERVASPPAPQKAVASNGFELPQGYGENQLVLLVRDPWWIYAYWEVTPERENHVRNAMAQEGTTFYCKVLRVYDVTGKNPPEHHSFFDIEFGFSGNWYVDVGTPDREWMAEIGLRTPEGRFFAMVRSNIVRTPRFGVSDILDEEWLLPDELYWKIFGLSGGITGQKSSLAVKEVLERYLRGLGASENSPNVGSRSKFKPADDCLTVSPELILERF